MPHLLDGVSNSPAELVHLVCNGKVGRVELVLKSLVIRTVVGLGVEL